MSTPHVFPLADIVVYRTIDYAYGVQGCLDIASGSRKMPDGRQKDKAGNQICPDKDDPDKPGVCNPDLSIDNADSLSIMAGGLWFSDKCERTIPIGLTANPPPPAVIPEAFDERIDPPEDGDGIDSSACDGVDPSACENTDGS